jgi:hypothetical protein
MLTRPLASFTVQDRSFVFLFLVRGGTDSLPTGRWNLDLDRAWRMLPLSGHRQMLTWGRD